MSILCAVNHSQSEFECVGLFQMLKILKIDSPLFILFFLPLSGFWVSKHSGCRWMERTRSVDKIFWRRHHESEQIFLIPYVLPHPGPQTNDKQSPRAEKAKWTLEISYEKKNNWMAFKRGSKFLWHFSRWEIEVYVPSPWICMAFWFLLAIGNGRSDFCDSSGWAINGSAASGLPWQSSG